MDQKIIEHYVKSTPQLDPTFFALRKAVYDKPDKPWIKAGALDCYWINSTQKLGPLPMKVLSSAFGWEMPSWTKKVPETREEFSEIASSMCSLKNWDMAQINAVSVSQADALRTELEKLGAKVVVHPYRVFVIQGFNSYDEFNANRSGNAKKKLRYNSNTLKKGNMTVRNDDLTWEGIVQVLDNRKAGFANGADYTQTEDFRKFFKAFREKMKAENRLHEVGIYENGEKLIAYTLGFEFNGVLRDYQGAFMKDYTDYSLGFMCIESYIKKALDSRHDFIDYMGDAHYLSFHTSQVLELKRLVVFAPHLRGKLLGWLMSLKRNG